MFSSISLNQLVWQLSQLSQQSYFIIICAAFCPPNTPPKMTVVLCLCCFLYLVSMIWGQSEEMGSIDEVDSHPVPSSYCTGPGSANVHVLQNIRYFTLFTEKFCANLHAPYQTWWCWVKTVYTYTWWLPHISFMRLMCKWCTSSEVNTIHLQGLICSGAV